jgi:hypothetical protein
MEIDRRDLLTGLTAATVAALLPASPALGSIITRRWYLPKGLLFSLATPWSDAAYGLSGMGRIFATGSAARARFIFGAGIVIPAVISRPMLKTRPR